jgi:hypothetical protein
MHFPSFGFVGALYVVWVSFTWVYFLLEPLSDGWPAWLGTYFAAIN